LTTLFVTIALLVLGGGIIHDFAFALTVGIVVGTYSSVYVASPILIAWQTHTRKR
jgi:preprotein translocase subunit SecF